MIMILKINFQAKETKKRQVNKTKKAEPRRIWVLIMWEKESSNSLIRMQKETILRYSFLKAIQLAKIKRLIKHHVGEQEKIS